MKKYNISKEDVFESQYVEMVSSNYNISSYGKGALKNKFYNYLWIPCIRNANKVMANSSQTYNICVKKGIRKDKLSIIHPGVSFPPKPKDEHLIQQLIA